MSASGRGGLSGGGGLPGKGGLPGGGGGLSGGGGPSGGGGGLSGGGGPSGGGGLSGRGGPRDSPTPDDTPPRVRLFVAVEPPPEVRDALVGWGEAALSGRRGIRLLTSDHVHVTLCFLGSQPERATEQIAQACRSAADAPAGVLAVDQATWLPPRRPRVLAVRLVDEDKAVIQLQSRLSELLQAGGWYVPERRPYLPHVTVARVGSRTVMRPFALPSPPVLSFPASRITLFRSRLSPTGAQYEGLASVEVG